MAEVAGENEVSSGWLAGAIETPGAIWCQDRSERLATVDAIRRSTPDGWLLGLLACLMLAWCVLAPSGYLTTVVAPDSPGYLATVEGKEAWGQMRHPLYGAIVTLLGGPASIAALQMGLLTFSVVVLFASARRAGIGGSAAFALSATAFFSQAAFLTLHLLIPEALAIAFGILALSAILYGATGSRAYWISLVPAAVGGGAAYLLRPTFLPLIAVFPALWFILALRQGAHGLVRRALLLACVLAIPLLGNAAIRIQAVGDAHVVSFGGFQMSAMAGFMLQEDTIARLPPDIRPTARAVLAQRQKAETAGTIARTPQNALGVRSFASAALGYFDIYARSYDTFLWENIAALREPGESWVAFDRRLLHFAQAVIMAEPRSWMAWIAGASGRFVGKMMMANATFLLACSLLLGLAAASVVRRRHSLPANRDILSVSLIAAAWLLATAPLTVLTTFPAIRYIDTAGLFVGAIPLALCLAWVDSGPRRESEPRGGVSMLGIDKP
ncbi:hypothetical protein [Chelatococcus asaccharovorans]|uniref:hypothetical protein n=1 Tax=Chelatococcus asaccharovorans TaxID=28210 RepID=UPI00224C7B50|nr:hypothetical protein [Chelatococcus asaccharovorans]CAH1661203.1 conserved membrane hypothetical protein [Chelatococcus asaccharovorans]CAH1683547.1 conserved membrane hypothetical protein [Chelatococcus asaccharovorans]